MTLSIKDFFVKLGTMAFSTMKLSKKGLFDTLSITTLCLYAEGHYAECDISLRYMLNVVMQNVVMLSCCGAGVKISTGLER